jgi:hypothetical protein
VEVTVTIVGQIDMIDMVCVFTCSPRVN